jgi:hypothetical protein
MTPKKRKDTLKGFDDNISMCESSLEQHSDETTRKRYEKLLKEYQYDKDEFLKKHPLKIKKVPIVHWTPVSKGEISKDIFEGQPFLTVNVKDTYTERPTYDSIRKYWLRVSDVRCENLVEEMGYIVGVIYEKSSKKYVVVGVVQVENWKRHEIREGENQGRVEFMGELLTDHPSIDCILKDVEGSEDLITVSGTLQGFNFPDQEKKDS